MDPAAKLRHEVDRVLERFLAAEREEFARLDPRAVPVVDEVARVVASGGKRLRPLFCYAGHRLAGGAHGGAIVAAAASLELLHTFAIVHDDVMDRSPLRRGRPSLHRRVAQEYRAGGGPGEPEQFGVAAAILAGDLAFALSDRLFVTSGFDPEALARAAGPLHDLRVRAVAGQFLDLLHAGRREIDPGAARRIARLKTASYSVEGPLLVGAALAGGDGEVREALSAYGLALGEAYQVRDDVLGLFGDPADTGKDVEGDIRQATPTTLLAEALFRAGPSERESILAHWGNPEATVADVDAVRRAVAATGAPGAALEEIGRLVGEARNILGSLRVPAETEGARAMLYLLADKVGGLPRLWEDPR